MFKILPNTALRYANAEAVSTPGGGVSTGYDIDDMAHGPRSKLVRLDATTSTNRIGYRFDTPFVADYAIVAGAHHLLTSAGTNINSVELDESNSWVTGSAAFTESPLVAGDLVGPKSQDYIAAIPTASRAYYGFGMDTNSAGTEAAQFSKLYVSQAFDFDVDAAKSSVRYRPIRDADSEFMPPRGWFPYNTQAMITATISGVTTAKLQAWHTLIETDKLFERAFFAYDESAYLLQDKLYHVLLENYTERIRNWGYWNIDLTFRVLRYYD